MKPMRGIAACLIAISVLTPIKAQEKAKAGATPRSAEETDRAKRDPVRVFPSAPPDGRLGPPRGVDGFHPWTPPADKETWERRKQQLRTQVLVSQGLWPLPERTPLHPIVHGRVDRDDYVIEKVLLNTRAGHYLAGNLYLPKRAPGRRPAVLCPHGHWEGGRFAETTAAEAEALVKGKGESFAPNARYHLQALPATLARQGYVAFAYDMIGYADSKPLDHPRSTLGKFNGGFEDAESLLRLHSFMGLQTWNSMRALDFVASLPEVDPTRIAVTGGSGGGTQTMLLCAIDDRPKVSFPAVMISTGMQGGCVCENAPLLRIGDTNVELAAMHAPKPLGMTGADDWTVEIETKGLPELKRLYRTLGASDAVAGWCMPQFKHNYNQVSRELLYAFLNRHLAAGVADVSEKAFIPCTVAELSVFDESHPRPADYLTLGKLKERMSADDAKQYAALLPTDSASLERYRAVVRPALQAMLVDELPADEAVTVKQIGAKDFAGWTVELLQLGRRPSTPLLPAEAVPAVVYMPKNYKGRIVVWVDAAGHVGLQDPLGPPNESVQRLLRAGVAVLAPDVFLTGEFHRPDQLTPQPAVDQRYAGFSHCYNRSVLANRVHDVLTSLVAAKSRYRAESVDLVGFGEAGPWALLAKAVAGDFIRKTSCDFASCRFAGVRRPDDLRLLPGGLKYSDVPGLAILCAPGGLYIADSAKAAPAEIALLQRAYTFAGMPQGLTIAAAATNVADAIDWLLR